MERNTLTLYVVDQDGATYWFTDPALAMKAQAIENLRGMDSVVFPLVIQWCDLTDNDAVDTLVFATPWPEWVERRMDQIRGELTDDDRRAFLRGVED